jgi:hypothetical protein
LLTTLGVWVERDDCVGVYGLGGIGSGNAIDLIDRYADGEGPWRPLVVVERGGDRDVRGDIRHDFDLPGDDVDGRVAFLPVPIAGLRPLRPLRPSRLR